MLTYVTLFTWTDQGAKNVKETVSRTEKAGEVCEKMGGHLLSAYWTQGSYDMVTISEWPDEDTFGAFMLGLTSLGNSRPQNLRAFTAEDMKRFFEKMQ